MSQRVLRCTGILVLAWSGLAAIGAPSAMAAKSQPATPSSALVTEALQTVRSMRPAKGGATPGTASTTTTTTTTPTTQPATSTAASTPVSPSDGAGTTTTTSTTTTTVVANSSNNKAFTSVAEPAPVIADVTPSFATDGSGTMTASPTSVSASALHNTVIFTYTADTGGLSAGAVTLTVPASWSAPSTSTTQTGFTTADKGTRTVSSRTITVSNLTLASAETLTITYGDRSLGGQGATAPSSPIVQSWPTAEKSTAGGVLTSLATSPSITVAAKDGTGTLTTPTKNVSASSTGNTIVFTYTAPIGGLSNGVVTVTAPTGWSAPSTTSTDPGASTASAGTVSASVQTVTVSGVTLTAGQTLTITYGDMTSGPGATAPSTPALQKWPVQERSSPGPGGTLKNLSLFPSITVKAPDGSGTLTTTTKAARPGSTGNAITFTYKAATGGMFSGTVTLTVPAGWSPPSTTGTDPGFTKPSAGTVSVVGQTITVSGLTKSAGQTFTIVYGSKSLHGPGATAPSSPGPQTWTAQERSTPSGTLTNLALSPSIMIPTHTIESSGVNGCSGLLGGGSGRFCFMPNTFGAPTGTTVTFANMTSATHDVDRCDLTKCPVDGGNGLDAFGGSPDLRPNDQYTFTFSGGSAGTYNYFCSIHGYAVMHGTITIS
jgi:mucin-6/19